MIRYHEEVILFMNNLIFVTTGTQKFQFDRLLKEIDSEIERGTITEDVFAQIGASTYIPVNYLYQPFMPAEKMQEIRKKSSLIITHAGTSSIIEGIKLGIPVITVPRQKKYKEHVDDHQMEITKSMEKDGMVIAVYDIHNLGLAIKKAREITPPAYHGHGQKLLHEIEDICLGKVSI